MKQRRENEEEKKRDDSRWKVDHRCRNPKQIRNDVTSQRKTKKKGKPLEKD